MADRGLHESRAGGRCGGWAARNGVTHEERERQHPDSHEDHDDVQDLVTQLHASPGRLDQGIETPPESPVRFLLVVESVPRDALSTGSFERKTESPRGEETGIFCAAEAAGSAAVQETVRLKVRNRLGRGPAGFLGTALQSLPLGPDRKSVV